VYSTLNIIRTIRGGGPTLLKTQILIANPEKKKKDSEVVLVFERNNAG
jgi:hypothetical protein